MFVRTYIHTYTREHTFRREQQTFPSDDISAARRCDLPQGSSAAATMVGRSTRRRVSPALPRGSVRGGGACEEAARDSFRTDRSRPPKSLRTSSVAGPGHVSRALSTGRADVADDDDVGVASPRVRGVVAEGTHRGSRCAGFH